jgi:hypothetical protein
MRQRQRAFKNWLNCCDWKARYFVRQASRLETQAEFLLGWETSVLIRKVTTDCIRLNHIMEINLIYIQSTDPEMLLSTKHLQSNI